MSDNNKNVDINFTNQLEKKATGEYSTSQIPLTKENNYLFQQLEKGNHDKKANKKGRRLQYRTPFIIEEEIESFKEYNLRMCFQEYEDQPMIPIDTSKLCCGKKNCLVM